MYNSLNNNGKYILNYKDLQIGDMILENGNTKFISNAIKIATNSDYSHAMICVDNTSLIHATSIGVFSLNPQRKLVDNRNDFKVLRLKNSLNNFQQKEIEKFLRLQVGTEYSIKDALYVAIKNKDKKANNKQFCSRLVAQAYNYIGIKLVNDIDFCSPADLESTELLVEVKDMVRETSQADINFANTSNLIEENKKSFFNWLNKTKNLSSKYNFDIINDNDVPNFLYKYPKEDNIVCQYIQESGYLDNWKIEVLNNPQMHNIELFEKQYKDFIVFFILEQWRIILSTTDRYAKNYIMSIQNYKKTNLEYFKLHIELYRNLLQVSMSKFIILFEIAKKEILKTRDGELVIVFNTCQVYIEKLEYLGIEIKNLDIDKISQLV